MAELIEKIKISELTETTTADDASYIPIDNGNVTYKITVANYNSGANATAKSYAEAAATSATAAAGSATSVENALDEVENIYNDFEDEKLDLLNQFSSITQSVQSASNSATSAATSATSAATSAQNCATIETSVREGATLAESWAVGGTNTRVGEDTDNAKYYAEQTQERLDHLIEEFDIEEYIDQYMTQHPATVTSVNGARGDVVVNVPENTSDLTNDSGFITSADVPTKTSDLTNDSGFITSADIPTVPTKVSDLTNDSGYVTASTAPVRSVNGQTGAVTIDPGVTSFNGNTGAVTGVSSFNGNTGAVTYTAPVTSVNGRTGAVSTKCVIVDCGTISSLPKTITNVKVLKDMVVVHSELGTPSAMTSEWTVNTDTAGQFTIRGTISGSTTLKLYFIE